MIEPMTVATFGPHEFAQALDVSRETLARFEAYADLLVKWQARMNLIGPATVAHLWRRHFLDSAQLLERVRDARGLEGPAGRPLRWLDIGSGAGFPGLVLALMGAGEVHLVEANARKAAFLSQAIQATGATARVHRARVEALAPMGVDIVTARACARIATLIDYGRPHLAPDGEMWLLKGQDVEDELTEAAISWTMTVDRSSSRSDPSGTVVRLRDFRRVADRAGRNRHR